VIPSFDPALWRRVSWTVLSLALVAFIFLGLAEQGSRGGGLLAPPDSPLPFERHRLFGLDLSQMSSVQALDWLNAAGNPSLALILIPVDADVVDALAREDGRDAALNAIDRLRQAAGGSPLGLCLDRPPDVVGGLAVAQAVVEAIEARFPDQVVFVRSCHQDSAAGWQGNLDAAARPDAVLPAPEGALIPLAGTSVIAVDRLNGVSDLSAEQLRLRSQGRYAIYTFETSAPLDGSAIDDAAEAMSDTSHTALFLVTPVDAVDPAALVGSFSGVVLAGDTLPEGFSSIVAPSVRANDQWQRSNVGTVSYLRSTSASAALAVEFVGTDIYLAAIESPESGMLHVWIDPSSPTAAPTLVLDLASFQARDAAIPLASGLPAARHEVIMQAVTDDNESIAISGLFVTGKPATAWTGTMAAAVVLLAAIVALVERSYTAVVSIRRRSTPPRRRPREGHPRVFARDR